MKPNALEPGLLPVFRLYAVLQWVFVVMEVARQFHIVDRMQSDVLVWSRSFNVFSFVAITALVIYLWLPPIQRWCGSLFLPTGLIFVTVAAAISGHLEFMADYVSGLRDPEGTTKVWETTLVLVVPLLLIAWQYRFRAVLVFAIGTWLLDTLLKWFVFGYGDPVEHSFGRLFMLRTMLFVIAGYMIVWLMTSQRRQRQALANANAQLAHYAATLEQLATSRERNRLARELHDTLAHTLSGLAVELEAAKTLWENDSAQARVLLERSLNATRVGLTETRRAMQALRAAPLEDLGLILALRTLAESIAAQVGAKLDWQAPERIENLPPAVEQCVYRVAQEALENIVRHATAKNIGVCLVQDDKGLTFHVSDDGRGFDPGKVDSDKHLGLKGMRERAEMIGGKLEIESRLGRGTTVRLIVEGKT